MIFITFYIVFCKDIKKLILGCTHHGLVKDKIEKVVGKKIRVIDEEEIIPDKLGKYLKRHRNLFKSSINKGLCKYYITDSNKQYFHNNYDYEVVKL